MQKHTRSSLGLSTALLIFLAGLHANSQAQAPVPEPSQPDRTVLPIQQPKPSLYTELDARKAKPPARFEVKAPAGAPNVLIDDMGFGQSSPFAWLKISLPGKH
jgi:hypothetical protein